MKEILNKNIISTLGIDSLELEERKEVLERIGKLIYQGVMIQVIEKLDEKSVDELEKIVETHGESPEGGIKILEFIKSKKIDIESIVEEETIRFKQDSYDLMSSLEKED